MAHFLRFSKDPTLKLRISAFFDAGIFINSILCDMLWFRVHNSLVSASSSFWWFLVAGFFIDDIWVDVFVVKLVEVSQMNWLIWNN